MSAQSRKWMILVVAIWIQAFTGTNFDFSAYSSEMKSVLGISQARLNYLAVASDIGKLFGWSSGLAIMYLPVPAVLFAAATMGLAGYGFQWLAIVDFVSLPYVAVFLCCLLAGLSICWFNTVCFVLCIRNFPSNLSLALSLTVSFNGLSPAIYTLAYNAAETPSPHLFLLLNAILPLAASLAAVIPILRQPSVSSLLPEDVTNDSYMFLLLYILAVLNGVYLLRFGSNASSGTFHVFLLGGAIILLISPLCIPCLVYARESYIRNIGYSSCPERFGFELVNIEEPKIHKGCQCSDQKNMGETESSSTCEIDEDQILEEEDSVTLLMKRLDFWLYYVAYLCGGTIGLVYSNNLGQIAQSLGQSGGSITGLVTRYSSFSFFGRLLSAAPNCFPAKLYFARTGWLAIALLPTPTALFLLASSSDQSYALQTGTALIGLSSGFVFAAAVSVTYDLFGPNRFGLNHNILITNIPIGSLAHGFLAASVYNSHGDFPGENPAASDSVVICRGRDCYFLTFAVWGCLSVIGFGSSLALFLRTRKVYQRFEQDRSSVRAD